MPRMAARTNVRRETPNATARRPLSIFAAVIVATGGSPLAAPLAARADAPAVTVLLPGDTARTLSAGAAGWTATAQVAATGCAPGSCPTASGAWGADIGAGGVGDGALDSRVAFVAGNSGVATVTWRSPLFLAPPVEAPATFTMALDPTQGAVSTGPLATTYSVRLVDTQAGSSHTIVDHAAVPGTSATWTNVTPVSVGIGVIAPSALHRIEIEFRVPLGAGSPSTTAVRLDRPTLAMLQPAAAAPAPATPAASLPSEPWPQASLPAPSPADLEPSVAAPSGPSAPRACGPDPIALVGASALARRIRITGVAAEPAGTGVQLLSADGWNLGRTAVGPGGRFAATLTEPAGSQGTRTVVARLPGGEQSAPAPVQRRNVLRAATAGRGRLVVEGRLDPKVVRSGRVTALVQLAGASSCDPVRLLGAAAVAVDRRTGRYRLTAKLPAPRASGATGAGLVRTTVTARPPGRRPVVMDSQLTFAAGSDRPGS